MHERKLINIVLTVLAVLAAFIIVFDFVKNRAGKNIANPYELEVSSYDPVDQADIISEEIRTIQLPQADYKGIDYHENLVWVISGQNVIAVDTAGLIVTNIALTDEPTAIVVADQLWMAFTNYVACFDKAGNLVSRWTDWGTRSVVTSMVLFGEYLYVADAGNRIVYQYRKDGTLVRRIGEKDPDSDFGGLIIPSPYMDVEVDPNGILWVSNPGKHSLVSFNTDGSYRSSWANSSPTIEGFSGCCNPSHFALMGDNSFVTSEKMLLRVKRYDEHGEFRGVYAPGTLFDKDSFPPDICVDDQDNVILLDLKRDQIRYFKSAQI